VNFIVLLGDVMDTVTDVVTSAPAGDGLNNAERIMEVLKGMAIGIPGVFAVLGIFYITIKLFGIARREKK